MPGCFVLPVVFGKSPVLICFAFFLFTPGPVLLQANRHALCSERLGLRFFYDDSRSVSGSSSNYATVIAIGIYALNVQYQEL